MGRKRGVVLLVGCYSEFMLAVNALLTSQTWVLFRMMLKSATKTTEEEDGGGGGGVGLNMAVYTCNLGTVKAEAGRSL